MLILLTVLAVNARVSESQTNDGKEYSLRLNSDVDDVSSGVLEVTYNNISGGICPDGWDDRDARVACRELGFQHGTATYKRQSRTDLEGQYMTSNVDCTGTETMLGECSFTPFGGIKQCGMGNSHEQVAGVHCHNFEVQLYPDTLKPYGAVVFNQTGASRLLCADGFDQNAATVVCRQLGFKYGRQSCCSAFGPIEFNTDIQFRITTDTIKCTGSEQHLSECTFSNDVGDTTCTQSDREGADCQQYCTSYPEASCNIPYENVTKCTWANYAGVICANEDTGVTGPWYIRPVIKVKYFSHYGYVCSENHTDLDASVWCATYRYKYGVAIKVSNLQMRHAIRWFRDSGCKGTETNISECTAPEWGQAGSCHWDVAAAVICSQNTDTLNVEVEIVDGHSSNTTEDTSISGRVEIVVGGRYGGICSNFFNHSEARVLCRHLGYQGGKMRQAGSFGTKHNILSGLDCEGNEKNIRDCVWHGYRMEGNECVGDAAITCFQTARFVTTKSKYFGVLEMFDYGYTIPDALWNSEDIVWKRYDTNWRNRNVDKSKWWAICDTNENLDPSAVCTQWGFVSGAFIRGSPFGQYATPISDVERYCADPQNTSCPHNIFTGTCLSGKYVALYCSDSNIDKDMEEFEVRFPRDYFYGPVVVKRYGLEGYVCRDAFDDMDARVVCSELGYTHGKTVQTLASDFHIIQGAVECIGNEAGLQGCKRGLFFDNNNCPFRGMVAGVFCYSGDEPRFAATNQDKTFPADIAVEIIANNASVFVSVDNFDDIDASVYCRSLGYPGGKKSDRILRGDGKLRVGKLACSGNELSVLDCPGMWDPRLVTDDADFVAVVSCRPEIYLMGSDRSTYGAVVVTDKRGTGLVSVRTFDEAGAKTVCKKLGYNTGLHICCDTFGQLSEQVFLTNFSCSGDGETVSEDCTYDIVDTYISRQQHSTEYASVYCFNEPMAPASTYTLSVHKEGEFRLLIVTYMNIDGFICGDGWDHEDAEVACRELGLGAGTAYYGYIESTGLTGPFWISNVHCNGDEEKLENCKLTSFGQVEQCNTKPGFAAIVCSEGQQKVAKSNVNVVIAVVVTVIVLLLLVIIAVIVFRLRRRRRRRHNVSVKYSQRSEPQF